MTTLNHSSEANATIVRGFYGMLSTMVEYRDRLQQALDESGVLLPALAGGIGATYQAVKKVLDGKSGAFSAANNARAAAILGVRSDWLALGEGPMRAVDRWPFRLVSESKVRSLDSRSLAMIEMALAMAADKYGIDIKAEITDNSGVPFHSGAISEASRK